MTSSLLEPSSIEKIFELDAHIGCAMSGLTADSRTIVDHARVEAQVNWETKEPREMEGWEKGRDRMHSKPPVPHLDLETSLLRVDPEYYLAIEPNWALVNYESPIADLLHVVIVNCPMSRTTPSHTTRASKSRVSPRQCAIWPCDSERVHVARNPSW